jgi:hypothetical protein
MRMGIWVFARVLLSSRRCRRWVLHACDKIPSVSGVSGLCFLSDTVCLPNQERQDLVRGFEVLCGWFCRIGARQNKRPAYVLLRA